MQVSLLGSILRETSAGKDHKNRCEEGVLTNKVISTSEPLEQPFRIGPVPIRLVLRYSPNHEGDDLAQTRAVL